MATRKAATAKRSAVVEEDKPTPERAGSGRSIPVLVPEMHVRHLPLQVPGVHVPSVHVPGPVRDRLPEVTTNRALWWGGLALLAVTEVISWPVAGVVAAGTYVAERRAKAALQGPSPDEHAKQEVARNRRTASA